MVVMKRRCLLSRGRGIEMRGCEPERVMRERFWERREGCELVRWIGICVRIRPRW